MFDHNLSLKSVRAVFSKCGQSGFPKPVVNGKFMLCHSKENKDLKKQFAGFRSNIT